MPGYKYKGDRPESSPEQAPTPEAEPRPLDVWIPRAEAEDRIKAAETVAHRAAAALERERAERAGERVAVRERARATERLRAAERDKFRAEVEQLRTRLRAVHRERAAAEAEAEALRAAGARTALAATTNRARVRRLLVLVRERGEADSARNMILETGLRGVTAERDLLAHRMSEHLDGCTELAPVPDLQPEVDRLSADLARSEDRAGQLAAQVDDLTATLRRERLEFMERTARHLSDPVARRRINDDDRGRLPTTDGPAAVLAEVRVKALEGALADSCKIVEDLTAQRDHATARAITYQARLDMIHAQSRSIPEKREQTP